LSLLTVVAFCGQRYFWSGMLLSFGIGCKLYPVLFLPPLLVLAWRRKQSLRFLAGVGLGLLPLLASGVFLPWWRFLMFHHGRGLQVESLYASCIWLLNHLGYAVAKWQWVKAWTEVSGPAATMCLPFAQAIFLATVAGSVCLAVWRALHLDDLDYSAVSRILVLPLLAFVSFNIILSPQYLIWLVALTSAAAAAGPLRNIVLVVLAAILIPVFYPCPSYGAGLNLFETCVLVLRNLLLIAAWSGFAWEMVKSSSFRETLGILTKAWRGRGEAQNPYD
jgi:hypothetical protein